MGSEGFGIAPTDLSGSTSLVAGASRGIGRSVAVGLAAAGASVVGLARSAEALDSLGEEIAALGGDFMPLVADISDLAAIEGHVERAWRWRGGLESLANAAGVTNRASALDISPAQWDALFDVNLRGAFFLTREVGRRMLDGEGGSIVSIASLSGVVSDGAQVAYSASKAGLIHMSAVLADHWAPKVRLNCVSPAWVETDMTRGFLANRDNTAAILRRTPMGRIARPEEMVGAVLFLVSGMSSYMTGQNLIVDGGWTA
ncbi:MAG: SDR family NAD(P)-dependent oxidoreductase [bacterium]|nr:SDR family NAD(P)-dependent oxidoreductase [bacterium]MDE0290316.1 SDR family NAD(P)-dependent oxidoreductase [bacterium]MDE0438844.1 SDR family NAD(P)-dependent oxidoreductase [bacterium]